MGGSRLNQTCQDRLVSQRISYRIILLIPAIDIEVPRQIIECKLRSKIRSNLSVNQNLIDVVSASNTYQVYNWVWAQNDNNCDRISLFVNLFSHAINRSSDNGRSSQSPQIGQTTYVQELAYNEDALQLLVYNDTTPQRRQICNLAMHYK